MNPNVSDRTNPNTSDNIVTVHMAAMYVITTPGPGSKSQTNV